MENFSLTLGGDVYWEDGSSDAVLGPPYDLPTSFDLDRVVGGPFAEVQWQSDLGFALTTSLRADFPDSASAEITPRVSARYRLPRIDVLLAGSWGEGFKLPAFYSLAAPVVGNPGLDAEHSQGWDISLSRSFWGDRIEGRLGYFQNKVKDLIHFDPGEPGPPPVLPRLVNRSKVTSKGVEVEFSAKAFDSLELEGQLTYTKTNIVNSSENLLNRPRWRGGWTASWTPVESVVVRVAALAVGKVKDSSIPTGNRTLDPWVRVDLSASWRPREHLTLYLEVDNLFDADYQEALGFGAPGVRPRVGAQWRL